MAELKIINYICDNTNLKNNYDRSINSGCVHMY